MSHEVWNHGDVVRAAQASFVARDPHAALVTSTDDYGYSDKWHYDSAGYLDLGREFANAIHGLRLNPVRGGRPRSAPVRARDPGVHGVGRENVS